MLLSIGSAKMPKVNIIFNEGDSVKILNYLVKNIWNDQPFTHVQLSDIIRLSRSIKLYDSSKDSLMLAARPVLADEKNVLNRIRDILCCLKIQLNEDQDSILETLNLFLLFKTISKDNQKSLEAVFSRMSIQNSLALKLYKVMANQSVLALPYVMLKTKLEPLFHVVDKKGFWSIPVQVEEDYIIVSHCKWLKSLGEFEGTEIEWKLDIYYDRNLDYIEKCEMSITSVRFRKKSLLHKKESILKAIEQKLLK